MRLRVPAVIAELAPLRRILTEWANTTPLTSDQVEALRLASYEAAANGVEHAYRGQQAGFLDVVLVCRPQQGTVAVSVTDHGSWRPAQVTNSLRGRGLALIHALTDHTQITTSPTGTSVHMSWTLDSL